MIMANNNSLIHNTGLNKENSLTHLLDAISPEMENEIKLIHPSKYYDDEDFKVKLNSLNNGLCTLSLNCQSINAKFDKLKLFLDDVNTQNPISVICIQESWGHEEIDIRYFSLPNYTLINANRRLSLHGGLITYIHDDFAFKELNDMIPISSTSTLFVEIWKKNSHYQKYIIGNIYRLPVYVADDLNVFINEFTDLLIVLGARSKSVFLCGDYNIDLLKINANDNFNMFYENVISSSFIPSITLPTRICDTTSTLIDNIYTNSVDKICTSGILIRPISDHQMYFCMINSNTCHSEQTKKFIEVEVCDHESIQSFVREISNANIYDKLQKNLNTNPNHNYEILLKHLLNAKLKHIPKKVKNFNKRRHSKEKWMTKELLQEIVTKNKMYVTWKTTSVNHINYEQVKQRFKSYEKIVKKDIKEAKQRYFDQIFTAYKNDMKKTWKTINETLNRNKKNSNVASILYHNGNVLSNAKDTANAFNVYFANIGKNLASEIEQNITDNADYTQYVSTPLTVIKLQFKCITDNDTQRAIDKLENKSSSGHDGISNKLLKLLKIELSKSLTLIINQMITTGIFPDSFKISKITPLFKKGDASMLSNYRPISLLPTISKIFERILYNQLYDYFNSNNLLAEEQYGFRTNHSTEYAAVKLVDNVSKEMELGNTPTALYIDLSKAFDTLSFDILLYKLNYYSIKDDAFKLLKNYLTNRRQYVVFNSQNSETLDISTGVPQGSILGPLFFSICINDLITVSNKLKFIMYADDTIIYFNLEDFDPYNLERDINNELEKITLWLKMNKLSLNVQKTKLMIFHRRQKQINELNISINGTDIERVDSFNFLGLHIHESLSWRTHTDIVRNTISKVVGILYRLNNIFPKYILQTLYNSLIMSYINYGLLLWGVECHRIEPLQKKAIRLITNSNYSAHTTPLFIELGLLKVQDMFKLKLLKFYYKLSYDLLPSYFQTYRHVIEREPTRDLRQHCIHPPLIRRVYAECSPLIQLIKLINILKADKHDTILEKIISKSHTYHGFSFNVTTICLNAYDPICRINQCYICNR